MWRRIRRRVWKLPTFTRHRHRHLLIQLMRLIVIALLCLFVIAFVTPARNFVGYYFIPASWLELSSGRIIQMFFMEEQRFPVESGELVTCTDIQEILAKVNWQHLISELDTLPAYDVKYYQHLAANPGVYGTSPEDVELLTEKFSNFKPPMSALWQKRLRLTFKVLDTAMKLFNVTYFLIEGSMLGVYRHHGFIPWDDDMDIFMNGTDWLKVKQILHCIPDFDVDTRNYMMYKFFCEESEPMKNDDLIRVPYIDIFFFTEDDEYIWALSKIKKHRLVLKKADIFPLTSRPFEDQMAYVPRRLEYLCRTMYDPTVCVSRDYDHLSGRPLVPFYEYEYKPCNIFQKYYPFVERQEVVIEGKAATVEVKKLGKKLLGLQLVRLTPSDSKSHFSYANPTGVNPVQLYKTVVLGHPLVTK